MVGNLPDVPLYTLNILMLKCFFSLLSSQSSSAFININCSEIKSWIRLKKKHKSCWLLWGTCFSSWLCWHVKQKKTFLWCLELIHIVVMRLFLIIMMTMLMMIVGVWRVPPDHSSIVSCVQRSVSAPVCGDQWSRWVIMNHLHSTRSDHKTQESGIILILKNNSQ